MEKTHIAKISRGRRTERFYVSGVKDDSFFTTAMRKAFGGRMSCPKTLTKSDGVRVVIGRISDKRLIVNRKVYNKSVGQVADELIKVIEQTPAV